MKHVGTTSFIISADDLVGLSRDIHGLMVMVHGCYKGQREISLLVVGEEKREAVKQLAVKYGQESVLEIAPGDLCWLLYTESGREEYIGKLREVDSTEGLEAWTEIDYRYYTAVK